MKYYKHIFLHVRTAIKVAFLAVFCLQGTFCFSLAIAEPVDFPQAPLAVVRFSADANAFDAPFKRAVERALAIKPATFFDIVSVIPQGEDKKRRARYEKVAQNNVEKIRQVLQSAGVREDRIRTRYEYDSSLQLQEARIYVR